MTFDLIQPCKDCPFKNDVPHQRGWLGKERAEGIIKSLYEKDQSFPCHKTTGCRGKKEQHCAGAMILMERSGRANQDMRISERLGIYDRNKLKMDTPVFDTPEQFINWHAGSEVVTEYQMRQARAAANEAGKPVEEESEPTALEVKKQVWRERKDEQFRGFMEQLKEKGLSDA